MEYINEQSSVHEFEKYTHITYNIRISTLYATTIVIDYFLCDDLFSL
jgi:hypothetical protein